MLIENKNGEQLLEIINIEEDKILQEYSPITHALVVVKNKGKFILLYNKYRKQWEIAGGCLEQGETLRECAERECYEEIGHAVVNTRYIGLMKFMVKANYFHNEDKIEYGALYCADISDDIAFEENNEMKAMCLYEQGMDIGYINEIDHKLLEYYQ